MCTDPAEVDRVDLSQSLCWQMIDTYLLSVAADLGDSAWERRPSSVISPIRVRCDDPKV